MEPEAIPPPASPASLPASPTSPPTMTAKTATATGHPDGDLVDLDLVEAELAGVEHALARLQAGTYGTCEACGSALGDALLEESPISRRCPTHA